jgi:hypothetical protein
MQAADNQRPITPQSSGGGAPARPLSPRTQFTEQLKEASKQNPDSSTTMYKLLRESKNIEAKYPELNIVILNNTKIPNSKSELTPQLAKNHIIIFLENGHRICSDDPTDEALREKKWESGNHIKIFHQIINYYNPENIKEITTLMRPINSKLTSKVFPQITRKNLLQDYQENYQEDSSLLGLLNRNLPTEIGDYKNRLFILDNNPIDPSIFSPPDNPGTTATFTIFQAQKAPPTAEAGATSTPEEAKENHPQTP